MKQAPFTPTMPVFRVFAPHNAEPTARMIGEMGCIVRQWETPYRGPIAIVGDGRIYAIAVIYDVIPGKASTDANGEPVPSFYWKIRHFREGPKSIVCPKYPTDVWLRHGQREPIGLAANANAVLCHIMGEDAALYLPGSALPLPDAALLAPDEPEDEPEHEPAPESLPDQNPSPTFPELEAPPPEAGQFSLF